MSVHLGKSSRALPHSQFRYMLDTYLLVTGTDLLCLQVWSPATAGSCDHIIAFLSLPSVFREVWKATGYGKCPWKSNISKPSKLINWEIYLPGVVNFDLFASTEHAESH